MHTLLSRIKKEVGVEIIGGDKAPLVLFSAYNTYCGGSS
jgi:hypothetical protein